MDAQTRLDQLRAERQALSVKAGQLQEQFNQTVIRVHQLDGAISALEEVLSDPE